MQSTPLAPQPQVVMVWDCSPGPHVHVSRRSSDTSGMG